MLPRESNPGLWQLRSTAIWIGAWLTASMVGLASLSGELLRALTLCR